MMTERSILFMPENYGKCVDGSKTQTRRIIALPKDRGNWESSTVGGKGYIDSNGNPTSEQSCIWNTTTCKFILCPFGTVGDRLYVKEGLEREGTSILYRRDKQPVIKPVMGGQYGWRWSRNTLSPLHMPKWAARLWLDITMVRVERLQEISETDAKLEGARGSPLVHPDRPHEAYSYVENFHLIWESIHGAGSWDQNPWVWVISFRRIQL